MRPARPHGVSMIAALMAPAIYSALSATSRAEPASAGFFFPRESKAGPTRFGSALSSFKRSW